MQGLWDFPARAAPCLQSGCCSTSSREPFLQHRWYPGGEVTAQGASPGACGVRGAHTTRGLQVPGGEGTKAAGARASEAKLLGWVRASVCYNLISPPFCSMSSLPFYIFSRKVSACAVPSQLLLLFPFLSNAE